MDTNRLCGLPLWVLKIGWNCNVRVLDASFVWMAFEHRFRGWAYLLFMYMHFFGRQKEKFRRNMVIFVSNWDGSMGLTKKCLSRCDNREWSEDSLFNNSDTMHELFHNTKMK